MAELHYFSFFVPDWLSSPAIAAMLPEQEGAYVRLLIISWGNGSVEPSLPVDDATLAKLSRLGGRWKKLGPLVRAQFQERDGRLYNAKLTEVWNQCQENHRVAVARASKGGKAKAENARKKLLEAESEAASSTAQAVPEHYQSKSKGEAEPLRVLQSPAADGKTGATAPLGAEAPRGRDGGGGSIEDPYVAAEKAAEPEVLRRHAIEKDLAEKYDDELMASVERWRPSNEAAYTEHRILAVKSLGLFGKQLGKAQLEAVEMATARRVRDAERWPTRPLWVAKRRDELLAEQARRAS